MKIHPQDLLLEELANSPSCQDSALLAHLAGCAQCRERLRAILEHRPGLLAQRVSQVLPWRRPPQEVDYTAALAAAERAVEGRRRTLEQEKREAPGLLAELAGQPVERRLLKVRHQRRFQTWAVTDLLIEQSREQCFHDPAGAEELARLALAVTEVLDADEHGGERIADLRARAWGQVANTLRVRFRLGEAAAAFDTAFAHLRQGTGETLERADLLDLKASLLRDQRRFDDAMRLLRRALSIFLAAEERRRAAKTLVKMSTIHEHTGPEQAVPLLTRALTLIGPGSDPRLYLNAQHNLITVLAEAGRFLEAQRLLREARPLYARFQDRWMRPRRSWLEGKIARGLGQPAEAEAHLLAARAGFLAEDAPYEAAFASLELASLYVEAGRTAELKRLAEETLPIFSARKIHREALAALSLWHHAVLAEQVGGGLAAEVAAVLKRVRRETEPRSREAAAD